MKKKILKKKVFFTIFLICQQYVINALYIYIQNKNILHQKRKKKKKSAITTVVPKSDTLKYAFLTILQNDRNESERMNLTDYGWQI